MRRSRALSALTPTAEHPPEIFAIVASMSRVESRDHAQQLDALDPLSQLRDRFALDDHQRYFAGHSLGPPAKTVGAKLTQLSTDQWAQDLVGGWNKHGWLERSRALGERLAEFMGAEPGSVLVADNTSINLFKLLAMTATRAAGAHGRVRIAVESEAFPGDRYIVQGLARLLGSERVTVIDVRRDELPAVIAGGCDIAVCGLVDFRSAHCFDAAALEGRALEHGCTLIWDLCHAVGAIELRLHEWGVCYAVGCTYKYLNAGPGAPAFVHAAPELLEDGATWSPIAGWFGHARPFAFESEYTAATTIEKLASGTPSILALAGLEAALDAWQGVDPHALRSRAMELAELFRALVARQSGLGELQCDSPLPGPEWGSHLSYRHPEAFALVRCLARRGIVGDHRAPDAMRFALCPLYTRRRDVWDAAQALGDILRSGEHRAPEFKVQKGVP